MPLSNDNQDYNDKENKDKNQGTGTSNQQQQSENFTSDDLKGKQKVDAEVDKESDRPAEQQGS